MNIYIYLRWGNPVQHFPVVFKLRIEYILLLKEECGIVGNIPVLGTGVVGSNPATRTDKYLYL